MASSIEHIIISEIANLQKSNERLEQMVNKLLQAVLPTLPVQNLSPADIAINMAKSGDIEGSKAYLKSLSRRKS